MSFPISAIRFQFIRKFIFTMLYLFMEQFNPTLPEQESAYPPNNNKCYKTYSHTPSNYFFKPCTILFTDFPTTDTIIMPNKQYNILYYHVHLQYKPAQLNICPFLSFSLRQVSFEKLVLMSYQV